MATAKIAPTLESYERALEKALEKRPAVEFVAEYAGGVRAFRVTGGESAYTVHFGPAGSTCNCPAGLRSYPCYHRAACLLFDLADAFNAALDASIASVQEDDARLAEIVGAWWEKHFAQAPALPVCANCQCE